MIGHERLIWRVNDDGEPSGTAGRPILGQINSLALTDIAIIVTRYFGGTLLGVSGLINAYRSAAASALENASLIEKTVQEYYEVTFPYISMNDVMRILKDENLGQSGQSFNLECKLILNFRLSSKEKVLARLSRIDSLNLKYIETR
jgi:putative IMPACT (imprinted ancient) family translation regulator